MCYNKNSADWGCAFVDRILGVGISFGLLHVSEGAKINGDSKNGIRVAII